VDDEPDLRLAVRLLMESIGLATKAYGSAVEFWSAFDPMCPGCILLDVRMPGMSGLELQDKLSAMPYHPPIIMVSGHGEVPTAVRAMKSGAMDFLQKPFSDQMLIERVQGAIEIDRIARARFAERQADLELMGSLTARETEVMRRVVTGDMNKVIAAELGISQRTVEIHRARVMEKLHVRSLAQLIRRVNDVLAPE